MRFLLFVISLLSTGKQLIKESLEKPIPAEYWANKELYDQDLLNGVSVEQRMEYLKKGRYYIPNEISQAYPVPHRDSKGKIIIENNQLFKDDKMKYGIPEAYKWAEQGKYNLNEEELKIEHLRLDRKMLNLYSIGSSGKTEKEHKDKINDLDKIINASNFDYNNTEAVNRWRRASAAKNQYVNAVINNTSNSKN